jgi:hypothetical protein
VGQRNLVKFADQYLGVAKVDGWRRIFLASALTGPPGAAAQLWRLDAGYPGTPGEAPAGLLRGYVDFIQHVANFRRVLLAPMPYNPKADSAPDGNPSLLIVKAHVQDGAMARLSCLKGNFFTRQLTDSGWRLVFAGHALTGPQSTVTNIWSLPDENSLAAVVDKMAHNAIYAGELAPLITEEVQNLYRITNVNS